MKKQKKNTAIVISEVALTERQNGIIHATTPSEFIKERIARGNKKVKYVEGGYIVSQLNAAFTPFGWQFEVLEHGILEGEVWVKGRLTIKDHKRGYEVFKMQFGQATRHKGVPLGDSLKSAATDCLKKAASSGLGVALDVYWKHLDTDTPTGKLPSARKATKAELLAHTKDAIKKIWNPDVLMEMMQRMEEGTLYNEAEKKELRKEFSNQIDRVNAKE